MSRTSLAKTKRGMDPDGLTDQHRRFVEEYTVSYNATRAARAAGTTSKWPSQVGKNWLGRKDVQRAIARIRKKQIDKSRLERDAILKKLAESLHRDIHDLCDEKGFVVSSLKEIPKEASIYIEGFKAYQGLDKKGRPISQTIEVKLAPPTAVLDMAMKYANLYPKGDAPVQETVVKIDWSNLYGPPPVTRSSAEEKLEEMKAKVIVYEEQERKKKGEE